MLIRSCQSRKENFVLLSIEWRVSLQPYRYQSLQPHQFRSQLWIFQVSRSSREKFGPSYIPPKVTVVGGGMVPSFSSNGDRDVLLRRKNNRNFDNANKNTKWNPRTSSAPSSSLITVSIFVFPFNVRLLLCLTIFHLSTVSFHSWALFNQSQVAPEK